MLAALASTKSTKVSVASEVEYGAVSVKVSVQFPDGTMLVFTVKHDDADRALQTEQRGVPHGIASSCTLQIPRTPV